MLQVDLLPIPSSGGGARVQSDDHHVQANLPAAKTTTHTMRNRNIETAKLACFLNSLRPSLIRVVRRKDIERTKRGLGGRQIDDEIKLRRLLDRNVAWLRS